MKSDGLAWFRRSQRTLASWVLALFCLAWLQLAALPCVMAAPLTTGPAAASLTPTAPVTMPAMESMAAHDCVYCPPAEPTSCEDDAHLSCGYPHDPQVDLRAGLTLAIAVPASVPAFMLARVVAGDETGALDAPPLSVTGPPLAVRYCRHLK